ncbi:MAG: DNA polymerase [Flavobacteriales bacterium]|nr:DNA polymerase [Flavobacteriales bacterium]MCW8937617.1 DNA polymerase [Flavobacteriales bacterium]MCW8968981.1 DNA polymerase [Flavobacteriales bacterium]MCW8990105.1 DNA polymerase [Flavobacteriales bacterium]MCW9019823.1 DNA polymerase [Flavobacteriales bacterium]
MLLHELLHKLRNGFCFDTETAGDKPGDALVIHSLALVGISFAVTPWEAYYLPVPQEPKAAASFVQQLAVVFSNPTIPKIGHNLKYDINVLRRYGVHVQGALFDTMIAHYLCNPAGKHGLKSLSQELLNYQQIEITHLIGKGKYQRSMRDIPTREVAVYACEDADQTLQLKNILEPMLAQKKLTQLFQVIECPLIYVLADMEYTGIRVDADLLGNVAAKVNEELITISKQLDELSGIAGFKPKSPAQLRGLLFIQLGLDSPTKTPTGNKSTGKKVLQKLQHHHPIIPLILRYKELSSLKSHFLASLIAKIHPVTGRVHTSFRQATVITGRLSSSNPNLQNIPKATKLGQEIRKAFVPRDDAHVLVAADYSQIELRVMAHFSQDPALIDAFNNGIDIHIATASKIFGVPPEQINSEGTQRRIAKTVNFGLNYMMSAASLAESIALATKTDVDVNKAKEYMDRYFEEFNGVARYQKDAYFFALEHGYSQTLFGRRRDVPDINSSISSKKNAAKRIAVNTPIQGSAADIIKKAMLVLHQELIRQGFMAKMVLQIHDELVIDVPRSELDQVVPLIRYVMENVVKLDVPLVVDIGVGENWLEAH